jgi:hypothetical protein
MVGADDGEAPAIHSMPFVQKKWAKHRRITIKLLASVCASARGAGLLPVGAEWYLNRTGANGISTATAICTASQRLDRASPGTRQRNTMEEKGG